MALYSSTSVLVELKTEQAAQRAVMTVGTVELEGKIVILSRGVLRPVLSCLRCPCLFVLQHCLCRVMLLCCVEM